MKGETQQMDRMLYAFAKRWCECNSNHGFKSSDVVHTICYSILLLNTDLHLADIGQKMTKNQFVRNAMPTVKRVAEDDSSSVPRVSTNSMRSSTFSKDDTAINEASEQDISSTVRLTKRPTDRLNREESNDVEPNSGNGGPLIEAPHVGSERGWESQVEIVLRSFYSSIAQEPLPLFGSQETYVPAAQNNNFLSLGTNMLRRTPSTLSKAPVRYQPGSSWDRDQVAWFKMDRKGSLSSTTGLLLASALVELAWTMRRLLGAHQCPALGARTPSARL